MPDPKRTSIPDAQIPTQRRGKRIRKEHAIYGIEQALGLNHINIADLSSSGYLSVEQIEAICSNPLAATVESDVTDKHVAKMITGEYPALWRKVGNRLAFRLGIDVSSMEAFPSDPLCDSDGLPLSHATIKAHIRRFRESIVEDRKNGFRMARNEFALRHIDSVKLVGKDFAKKARMAQLLEGDKTQEPE